MSQKPGTTSIGQLPGEMSVTPAERSLRIGIIYSRVPFPMMRGDQLTVAHLIAYLSQRGHKIDLMSLDIDGSLTEQQDAWLHEKCQEVSFFKHSKVAVVMGVLKRIARLQPMQVGYFENSKLTKYASEKILNGDYDIIYVYYLRSSLSVPTVFKPHTCHTFNGTRTAAFLAMQLSQTLNTQRIYENAKTGIKKLVYWIEYKLLRRFEARIWQNYTKTLLIGQADVNAVLDACRAEDQPDISNWHFAAHGTDVNKFRVATPEEVVSKRLVFSGLMCYEPNCQAILWFVEHCWPAIRQAHPDATLFIVGRDPIAKIRELDEVQGISVTGTVDDVGVFIRSASVCINPMLAAGGMQNKLIEYLASGVPVVATSVANEGIGAPPDSALRVADGEHEFAKAVCELLENRGDAEAMAQRGRQYILDHWTWEAHFNLLEEKFYSALQENDVNAQDSSGITHA